MKASAEGEGSPSRSPLGSEENPKNIESKIDWLQRGVTWLKGLNTADSGGLRSRRGIDDEQKGKKG